MDFSQVLVYPAKRTMQEAPYIEPTRFIHYKWELSVPQQAVPQMTFSNILWYK